MHSCEVERHPGPTLCQKFGFSVDPDYWCLLTTAMSLAINAAVIREPLVIRRRFFAHAPRQQAGVVARSIHTASMQIGTLVHFAE